MIVWYFSKNTIKASLDNHKSAISCIRFSLDDTKIFSGSLDTSIIVWDLISESCLYK